MKSLLLVDDEGGHVELMRHGLVEANYAIREAGTLAEARAAIADQRPDLALVDQHLPDGDGRELLALAADTFPIVLMTAHGDEQVAVAAIKAGALDFLVKSPAAFADLAHMVERALQQWALLLERRRAQAALQASEDRFRRLAENAPDLIYRYEFKPQRGYSYVSPAANSITGYTPEEHYADPDLGSKLVHPDDRPLLAATARGEITAGQPLVLRWVRKDGRVIWTEQRNVPIVDHAGDLVALEGIARDITERKTLESQFRQAQKMEIVGQLAGGVAHDFNNILTAMMLNLELLRWLRQMPDAAGPLKELETMTNRAAKLTQQLLMFARRQVIQTTTVDLNAALTNLLKMLRRLLGEHITLNLATDHPSLWVEVDTGMLDQAVMNLCINARDAMPGGGTLTLATGLVEFDAETARTVAEARPGAFVCLRVSDTGCGMSAEVLQHVFEPFFTTKEVGKGTGLGLASVHGIVHQHGGWVNVESTAGQGTTFRLFFPCSANLARAERGAPVAELMKGGNETILVVEDEEVVRRVTMAMLKKLGYRVLTAADGPEALRLWEQHGDEIDLLFTDVVMPGAMLGMQLAEQLRQSKPSLKVVLMSGYSAEILKSEARPIADMVFLPKPFESHTLAAVIRRCLDGAPAPPGGAKP